MKKLILMKKNKSTRGITLIALVITIIILYIKMVNIYLLQMMT